MILMSDPVDILAINTLFSLYQQIGESSKMVDFAIILTHSSALSPAPGPTGASEFPAIPPFPAIDRTS